MKVQREADDLAVELSDESVEPRPAARGLLRCCRPAVFLELG